MLVVVVVIVLTLDHHQFKYLALLGYVLLEDNCGLDVLKLTEHYGCGEDKILLEHLDKIIELIVHHQFKFLVVGNMRIEIVFLLMRMVCS